MIKQVNYNPLIDMKEAECNELKARIKELEISKEENLRRDDMMTSLVRYLDKSVKGIDDMMKSLQVSQDLNQSLMLMSDLANRSNDISAITMRREDEAHMKMKYEEQLDVLRKELKKEQSRLRQYDRFLS